MDDRALAIHLRSALLRLDDLRQLEASPLVRALLPPGGGADAGLRGAALRQALIDIIEDMKPGEGVSEQSPAWRQYTILRDRYVLRQPMWRIEQKLVLGDRQVRREHSRALANLAARLRSRLIAPPTLTAPVGAPATAMTNVQEAVLRLTPQPHVFSLAELMSEVVAMLASLSPGQIEWEAQPPDLTVYADRGILHQLLFRLLVRLGSAMSADARMRLVVSRQNDAAVVSINGLFKADPLADETLQLCRWLAQSLQTKLTWTGQPQALESVIFALPPGTPLRNVLIIDDELPAIELYESYLTGRDYRVASASRPDQALQAAIDSKPDVVVLDVMMPTLDGWEVLQRLRHTPGLENVPVIVCSVIQDAELALALGAARFLQKPILRQQLIEAIRNILAKP